MADLTERIGDLYIATSPSGKRYIGLTIRGAVKRWKDHVKEARRGVLSPLNSAIMKYGGDAFRLEVIAQGTWEELNRSEAEQIAALGTRWPNGYNLRAGGSQAARHPESIAKQAAKMRGRKWSPEHRAAHAAAMARPDVRAKYSTWRIGKSLSVETRKRMSEAHKGRTPPRYVIEAARAARIGSRHTAETKAKISATKLRNRILSG